MQFLNAIQEQPQPRPHGEQFGIAEQARNLEPQLVRVPYVIVVAATDIAAAGKDESGVTRSGQAGRAGFDGHHHPAPRRREPRQARVNRLLIMDHDAFNVSGVGLGDHGPQRVAHQFWPATRGNDHGDKRPLLATGKDSRPVGRGRAGHQGAAFDVADSLVPGPAPGDPSGEEERLAVVLAYLTTSGRATAVTRTRSRRGISARHASSSRRVISPAWNRDGLPDRPWLVPSLTRPSPMWASRSGLTGIPSAVSAISVLARGCRMKSS